MSKTIVMRRAPALVWLLAALGLALWKSRLGLEFYDEPFFVAPGFKLHALGDAFLKTEILNGPRWHDLLNYYLIRPWLSYSILEIRLSGLGTLFLSLLALAAVVFGKRAVGVAVLLLVPFFLFDVMGRPGWSYNDWARLSLIWHAFFLLSARRWPRGRVPFSLFAGMSMAFGIVAYHPLLLSWFLAFVLTLVLSAFFLQRGTADLRYYFFGFVLGLLPFLVFGYFHREEWQFAMDAISKFAEKRITDLKLEKLIGYALTRIQFWILLGAWAFWKQEAQIRRLGLGGLAILGLGHFIYKMSQTHDHAIGWVLGSLIALGFFSAVLLFVTALQRKDSSILLIALLTPACAFCMGMASWAGNGSLYWILPAAVLTAGIQWTESVPREGLLFVGGFLLLLNGATAELVRIDAFKDARTSQLTAQISSPPYTGIYTHPNREQTIAFFERVTRGKHFALNLGAMPQLYLFNEVRATTFSLWGVSETNEAHQLSALEFLLRENRLPDLIVTDAQISWKRKPFQQFADCIRGQMIERYGRYTAYEVVASEVEGCGKEILDPEAGEVISSGPLPSRKPV